MSSIYMNRELSWLKFNERVLEEAENPEVPLCERLTFASIYQSNLDEFFMVRVGSLYDQTLLDKKIRENKTGMTSQEQIDAILKRTKQINKRKEAVYEELMERVAEQGIRILRFNELDEEGAAYLERYFESEIAPLISPTVVGRRQPFPFLRNKEIYEILRHILRKDDCWRRIRYNRKATFAEGRFFHDLYISLRDTGGCAADFGFYSSVGGL